ncbi:MAG: triacylglycerol lipase [Ruminococcus sp.]|nr:triacylglycerol lipase [Ruminococcus sp.]
MLLLITLILSLLATNCVFLSRFTDSTFLQVLIIIISALYVLALCVHPCPSKEGGKLARLRRGSFLLKVFLVCFSADIAVNIWLSLDIIGSGWTIFANSITAALMLAAMLIVSAARVYVSSVQLGIKWRVLGISLAFIPIVNIILLVKMILICDREYRDECAREALDRSRAGELVCATRYPILFVHGVFFRDIKLLNYWGRIPSALEKNGAKIFYGSQQSADSVASCAAEVKAKIDEICKKEKVDKVNIIAHSKGGLDSRYAISLLGADEKVATLTTINTPHRGCQFAEYLLNKAPSGFKDKVANTYNSALKKLGDHDPDFIKAVTDLTYSACNDLNELCPDSPKVSYRSVGSKSVNAKGGRFPLNLSFHLVKYFDGENDGLVSVDSMKWGESFTFLTPKGKRGITHGDVIDLNRENIDGFDVREFYVGLVSRLKEEGY